MEDALTWQNEFLLPSFPHCVLTPDWALPPLFPDCPNLLRFSLAPHFPRYPLRHSCQLWLESNHTGQHGLSSLQPKPKAGPRVMRAAGEGIAHVSEIRKTIPQVLLFRPFGHQEPLWVSELLPHPWSTFTGFSIPCLKQIMGSCSCHFFLYVA